jgi:hypothetical protein
LLDSHWCFSLAELCLPLFDAFSLAELLFSTDWLL